MALLAQNRYITRHLTCALKSYQKSFYTKLTKTMAEEEEETAEVSNIPPMEEVCAVYGSNPSGAIKKATTTDLP